MTVVNPFVWIPLGGPKMTRCNQCGAEFERKGLAGRSGSASELLMGESGPGVGDAGAPEWSRGADVCRDCLAAEVDADIIASAEERATEILALPTRERRLYLKLYEEERAKRSR